MSGITITLEGLSNKDLTSLKQLAGKNAEAKAKAEIQAKYDRSVAAKAAAEEQRIYCESDEGKQKAAKAKAEAERLARFKASLDAIEQNDCYVVNGQLGNRKIYQVFTNLTAAKQWSKDLVAIGGRVYTREPVSCKMK